MPMKVRKIFMMLAGILLSLSCSGNQKKDIKNEQVMNKGKFLLACR